jgi:NAD-dependent SIR2 family protein deacetylase
MSVTPQALRSFIATHQRLFVLTGAGCSTGSGIPDYRDNNGEWKLRQPVQYQDFVKSEYARKRYWARSMVGWPNFARAEPNPAHYALALMESQGVIHQLVTQNVDTLHQRAGSRRVIDLHGRLDQVECLNSGNSICAPLSRAS